MKLNLANLVALTAVAAIRQTITDAFAAVEVKDSGGGMTLDLGSGPIVVCTGKPSMADERELREKLREKLNNPKVKLSRTNDVPTRCEQYDVASDPASFKKLHGKPEKPKTKTTDAKAEEKPKTAENATPPTPAAPVTK